MDIMLGSTSQIKMKAVEAACQVLGLSAAITMTSADSGISSQPVGREETERGARNRAHEARTRAPHGYAIGIENGIHETTTGWQDWAVIIVIRPDGTEILVDSVAISLPIDVVEETRSRGFTTTTVGQVLAEHFGCDPNDPHSFLSNGSTSRLNLLSKAIETALRQTIAR